jgi:ubiquinone biosynthesis protein
MAIATGRLSRFRDLAWFLAKYARADFLNHAGIEPRDRDRSRTPEAEALARDLEALGPTFIKLGQILSTRGDLLPPEYVDALARLQDAVEPFPYEEVERIVQEELGVRLSKAFMEFEHTPIAAASLGQVHRAVLRGGQQVAVKVQRPGIRERVLKDLDALDELAGLIDRFTRANRNIDAPRLLEEFRKTLMAELDYREEARNLRMLAGELRDFERLVVPLPIDDYSTTRVLTMEYVAGTKITAVSPVEWTEVNGSGLADDLFRAYLQQVLIDGVFHADPHPGNILLTPDHRIALIDLGMVGRLSTSMQDQLFKLMLAIADGRGDEAATIAIALGEKRDDFDEISLRRSVVQMVSRYHQTAIADLNVGRVMLEMARSGGQHGLKMSPDLALLGKTFLHLDEIGRVLDPQFDVNRSLRRDATMLMQRRMWKSATSANLFAAALEGETSPSGCPAA